MIESLVMLGLFFALCVAPAAFLFYYESHRWRWLRALLALVVVVFPFALHYRSLDHGSSDLHGVAASLSFVSTIGGLVLGAVVLAFTPRGRRVLRGSLWTWVAVVSGCAIGFLLGSLYQSRLRGVIDRGHGITSALSEYEAQYGSYPEKLRALVPTFLTDIPRTGLGFCPDYSYRLPEAPLDKFEGYQLAVRLPGSPSEPPALANWPGGPSEDLWILEEINGWHMAVLYKVTSGP